MNDKDESVTVNLKKREIDLILKSLRKCVPEVDDQEEVYNLVSYLENERKLG